MTIAPSESSFEVSNNDVLLEPSSSFCLASIDNTHNSNDATTTATASVGNNRFRILVDMNRKAYSDATNEDDRKAVVSKIIDIICNQFSPEGRFLERQATPIDSDNVLSQEKTDDTEPPANNVEAVEDTANAAAEEGASDTLVVVVKNSSPLVSRFSWRKLDLDETFYRVEQALQSGVTMDYPKSTNSEISGDGGVGDDDNVEEEPRSPSPFPYEDGAPESPPLPAASGFDSSQQQQQPRRRSSMASIAESFARVYQRRRSSAVDLAAANELRRRRRSSTIGSITETILVALLGSDASKRNSGGSNVNSNNNNSNSNNQSSSNKDAGKRRKKHLIQENYDDVLDDLLIPLPYNHQQQQQQQQKLYGQQILDDLHDEAEFDYVGGSARDLLHHGALYEPESEDFVHEHNTLDVIISYDGTQIDPRCTNPGNIRIKILMDNQQGSFANLSPKEQRTIASELVDTVQNHWSGRFLKSGIRSDHPYLVLTQSQAELALHALLLKRSRKYILANGGGSSSTTMTSSTNGSALSSSSMPVENVARLPALKETEDDDSPESSTLALGPKLINEAALVRTASDDELKAAAAAAATAPVKPPPRKFKLPSLNSLQKDAIQTLQARKQRSMQRQKINRSGNQHF